jgi:hypothetical protein
LGHVPVRSYVPRLRYSALRRGWFSYVEDFGADESKDLRLQVPRSPFVQEHFGFDGEAVAGDVALPGELEKLAGVAEIGRV